MANERNALAELAIRLGTDVLSLGADKYPEIEAAQRIVDELAKVSDNMLNASCTVAMLMRCRAIAEEGVGQ